MCQDLLAVGVLERKGKFLPCLDLRRMVVTLRVSKATHVDGLPRTVDAAVGINVEMMRELVVFVLQKTRSDAFLPVGIVLAARQLDVQIVPIPIVGQFCYAPAIGRFLPEQSIVAAIFLVEADLDALLRFARHRVCHHHTLLAFGQSDGHEGESRHGELVKNT